ncbi:DUF1553 domain-containing protein [bacterium]|nr:DUF1553 domain-containing protein [bacterium]
MAVGIAAIFPGLGRAADESPSPEVAVRFFETSVRPILVEHCQKCHGAAKQWAGLRLDSREAILQGGESGPAAVVGQPQESRLILAIQHDPNASPMPPDAKLSDREIAVLTQWVEQGLAFPASAAVNDARKRDPNHWSFQPIVDPPVPPVQNADAAQSPLDRFILSKLEASHLQPTAPTDKRTLIRRVTFDLTGLPPTREAVTTFLADDHPDAYARLVEELLSSPAYGERWGRHWLDVARYADSNGLDENVAHGNAWRYRDYVISALNADEPFDQFLTEQLAGDLLPAEDDAQRQRQLIATGFLAIGPKVLAEVDAAKMQMDIVDEQLETVGRAFMGMTFGCCRCHDHKFDPISTANYYGLAGIFKSTRAMEHYKKVARWQELPLPSPETRAMLEAHAAQIAEKQLAIESLIASARETALKAKMDGAQATDIPESELPAAVQTQLAALRKDVAQLEKSPPEIPTAMAVQEDVVADVAIHIRGNPLKLGDVVPRHVPEVLSTGAQVQFDGTSSGRLKLAEWMTSPQHPLTARVLVNRVWRWHFGRGIVASTDNFGLLGDAPTHPELLDWLACRLLDSGWSIKSLHRLIVLSGTYQQSSQPTPELLSADPENHFWGRFPVRRLEAEAIRDALLTVSGQLDDSFGGSLLKVKNRAYFFDHTSKDLTDYNLPRRSVYLPIVRNNLYDVFQLLDYPDAAIPTGDRTTTTIAPQALMLLNSEFVTQISQALATRLLAEESDDRGRLQSLIEQVYAREPTEAELSQLLSFLQELQHELSQSSETTMAEGQQQAWACVAQVLLASNEFVYIQ